MGRGMGVGRAFGDGLDLGVGVGRGSGQSASPLLWLSRLVLRLGLSWCWCCAWGWVEPPITSRKAALIGPQVWKPWKLFTPRPRTKITCRPSERLAVFIVASTATVGELNVPFMGMAVPPAQGGVSINILLRPRSG